MLSEVRAGQDHDLDSLVVQNLHGLEGLLLVLDVVPRQKFGFKLKSSPFVTM